MRERERERGEGDRQSQREREREREDNYLGPSWCRVFLKRVIIQVQSFIIKCLSFRRVSFVQGYRLCIEKLCT